MWKLLNYGSSVVFTWQQPYIREYRQMLMQRQNKHWLQLYIYTQVGLLSRSLCTLKTYLSRKMAWLSMGWSFCSLDIKLKTRLYFVFVPETLTFSRYEVFTWERQYAWKCTYVGKRTETKRTWRTWNSFVQIWQQQAPWAFSARNSEPTTTAATSRHLSAKHWNYDR